MHVYKIKVTSNIKLREDKEWNMLDLKLFKKNDLINKRPINSERAFHPTKQNLKEVPDRKEKDYTSFILNRYNAHQLMEYLHRDQNRNTDDIKGSKKKLGHKYSYAISHKPQPQIGDYEACSKNSAYIILKTDKKLNQTKLNMVNSEYRKITRARVFNKSHKEPKLIKEFWTGSNRFDNGRLVFKKSSPVVLKSTIKQIEHEECRNEFYSGIYKRNDVYDKSKRLYSFYDEEDRLSKSVYFIPKGTLGFKDNGTSPVIELEKEDYIKMAIQTLGLEKTTEKITNPRLSIIKVNKPNNGIENIFNVFGVAFELEDFSQHVFDRANVHGLGHYTGFGFGFAYTQDETSNEVKKIMNDNLKKKQNGCSNSNKFANKKQSYYKKNSKNTTNNNKQSFNKKTATRNAGAKVEDKNYSNGLFNN